MFSQFKELQLIILKHISGGSVIGFQHCCCFTFMQITLWQHLEQPSIPTQAGVVQYLPSGATQGQMPYWESHFVLRFTDIF